MASLLRIAPFLIVIAVVVVVVGMPTGLSGQEPVTVSIASSEYTFSESDGEVSITVELSNTVTFPVAVGVSTIDVTAISNRDFRPLASKSVSINPGDTQIDVGLVIVNDNRVELTETFSVGLEAINTTDTRVTVSTDGSTVTIEDDDTTAVALQRTTYRVQEGRSRNQVQVCCQVSSHPSCPVDFSFDVRLLTRDLTAVAPDDYTAVDTTLSFSRCGRVTCVDIPIVDDLRVEEVRESFEVTLERTTGLNERITLGNSSATIEIDDNDAALVGFEEASRTVAEGDSLSLKVVVDPYFAGDPSDTCVVSSEFSLDLTVEDPQGALSPGTPVPSQVTFAPCQQSVEIPLEFVELAGDADVVFTLGSPDDLDSRIILIAPTLNVAVEDSGRFHKEPVNDFNTLDDAGNNSPSGIWSNGTTMWVADYDADKIYAYSMQTKQRVADEDFDTLGDAGNNDPAGLWSDGTTMWVADPEDDKVYAYDLATKARDDTRDFDTLGDVGEPQTHPEGIWSNGATMWISEGDNSGSKIYAYNLETKARESEKDIDTLSVAENHYPRALWSNGTTIWAAEYSTLTPENTQLFAYSHATKNRQENWDHNNLIPAGNEEPGGIWAGGATMWVSDDGDDKIYAYRDLVKNPRVRPRSLTQRGPSDSISTDDPDPARPASVSKEECVSEVVDDDPEDIELGGTISGRWTHGCSSVTRGGRLAKYYTFTLPITTTVEIALGSHLDDYLVLRRDGLSGAVVATDDDSGPINDSLISQTLTAGNYLIEATTFYADGVEADFTLSVKAVPRILYDGPVSDIALQDYSPEGPTMTVRLLPTLPLGTLEVTIEDADGFGQGAGPLGGAQTDGGSSGTVILALPRTGWVDYGGTTVETRQSGAWTAHTRADEQAMLTLGPPGADLDPAVLALVEQLEESGGSLSLLESLAGLTTADTGERDESILDAIFHQSQSGCVTQVTIPWLVQDTQTTGIRVSVPLMLEDDDYLSMATSFVASAERPALGQLHDLLDTGDAAPECQPRPAEPAE